MIKLLHFCDKAQYSLIMPLHTWSINSFLNSWMVQTLAKPKHYFTNGRATLYLIAANWQQGPSNSESFLNFFVKKEKQVGLSICNSLRLSTERVLIIFHCNKKYIEKYIYIFSTEEMTTKNWNVPSANEMRENQAQTILFHQMTYALNII